jgi:hypothetical protein
VTADQIIERFESGAIANDSFHHADHVQLAFSYLNRYPVLDALLRFSCALKKFAAAHGKTQLYHETITCAYLFLIHERMASGENVTWEEFARDNPDLLIWKGGILNLYYRDATLKCDLARKVFLLPDKSLETEASPLEVATHQR